MPILRRFVLFQRMIKFSHSVFALPFAFTAALMAAGGVPPAGKVFFIILAMVGARSGAMATNRIVDRKIDAKNPRTALRELPSGKLGTGETVAFAVLSFAVLGFAAYMLNPLCFRLFPLAVFLTVFYSFTKRFTWTSHLFLGIAISLAPLGAWLAIRGEFAPVQTVLALTLAVVFWLAGFDVIYALQDLDFDKSSGLYSIPAKFGAANSLVIARLCHVVSMLMLVLAGVLSNMGVLYWAGLILAAGLFMREHRLVRADDKGDVSLENLNMAFFNMNGWISITIFAFTLLDYVLKFQI